MLTQRCEAAKTAKNGSTAGDIEQADARHGTASGACTLRGFAPSRETFLNGKTN